MLVNFTRHLNPSHDRCQSNTRITTSHAAIGASNSIPTFKAQANILIDHYAIINHMKPLQSDTCIIRCWLSYPIDHTLTPLSPQNTKHIINNIKNSPATGPDSLSNFHLKHLGPQGIQALTNISNYTYAHCLIRTSGNKVESSQYWNQIKTL